MKFLGMFPKSFSPVLVILNGRKSEGKGKLKPFLQIVVTVKIEDLHNQVVVYWILSSPVAKVGEIKPS